MRTRGFAALVAAAALAGGAAQAKDTDALIENALAAAPASVAATATVQTMKGKVLRNGTGPYTCFPKEGPGTDAMCLDAEWMRFADAWMKQDKSYKPQGPGLAYMLEGDSEDGGSSNIDPFAKAPTPENQWVIQGPHVMIILPDPAMLQGFPTDPYNGGPYVMWKDTAFAHIMMPIAPRS